MYKQFEYAQRRSTRALAHSYLWTLVAPVIVVGITLVSSERLQYGYGTSHLNVNSPAIFGVLLWISLSLQFHWDTAHALNAVPRDASVLAKGLARQIYLVCYFLAGAKVLQFIVNTPSPGLLLEHSMQGLQPYFGYAFSALVTVKAAAYFCAVRQYTLGP